MSNLIAHKVDPDVLKECKKVLKDVSNLRENKNLDGFYITTSYKKIKEIKNKASKLIKLLEDNYGV